MHIWDLEKWYRWMYLQNRDRDTDIEDGLVDREGEGERGTKWERSVDIFTLCSVDSAMSNSALLWTVTHQALQSMILSSQEYWSGLPCPPPGDLPSPGIKPVPPALQVDSSCGAIGEVHTHTTMCKTDSWWEAAEQQRKLGAVLCDDPEGWGGGGRERGSGGRDICILMVKKESENAGLKLRIQKVRSTASSPITSWQIDGETVADFIFLGSKITADGDCSHEIKKCLLLGRKLWQTYRAY